MNPILTESLIILVLLLANGVLAMAEIAVVCSRRARLRQMVEAGDTRARVALDLAESPTRFLSTVQIGITLVGILAGAFGGATLASELTEGLKDVTFLGPYAKTLSLALVVLGISFFSLILGELAPKRIALSNPERIASILARPMRRLSVVASPAVRLLSFCTDSLLRLLGVRPGPGPVVSEEEVKVLVREGFRAGVFHQVETEMVESVLALDQLKVRDIMTPRPKILWIKQDDPHDAIWHKIVVGNHSHFPVCAENRDHAVGILSVKAIYANLAAGAPVKVADLMTPPLLVPDTQSVIHLMETFKKAGRTVALAADEFGSIAGMVTLNDVMEAIVGDFPDPEERLRPTARKRDDGTWLVDAMIEIGNLESQLPGFHVIEKERHEYKTLAGFVVHRLGHVPREGDTFEATGYRFEVLDMDRHRVDKVLATPLQPLAPSAVRVP